MEGKMACPWNTTPDGRWGFIVEGWNGGGRRKWAEYESNGNPNHITLRKG